VVHGVDSTGISFGRIRALLIPQLPEERQQEVEREYLEMSGRHERAMEIKERLLAETRIEPGQYGEAINKLAEQKPGYRKAVAEAKARLDHLVKELTDVIDGKKDLIKPFAP
jgi:hypothetical protein